LIILLTSAAVDSFVGGKTNIESGGFSYILGYASILVTAQFWTIIATRIQIPHTLRYRFFIITPVIAMPFSIYETE
jgi:hypothetical protein